MTAQRRPRHALVAGAAAFVAAAFAILLVAVGGGLPFSSSAYTVRVILPTAGSLTSGARVTVAGAAVGAVDDVKRSGLGAVATLRITDDDVTPLPVDSRATLRMRTPVGENYVSIVPGAARASVPDGGLVVRSEEDYVEVDDVLSTLQGETRGDVRRLLATTGGALHGRGAQLNRLLQGTSGVLDSGSELTTILHRDRASLAEIVDELGALAEHLAERGDAIRGFARYGNQTLRAVADRQAAVGQLLAELPPTLTSVRRTTRALAKVSARATPVVDDLAAAVDEVRPAVERLRPAAESAGGLVRELGVTAPRLRPTLRAASEFARSAAKHLPSVTKVLCAVNPVLRYAQPYTPDIIAVVTGLGSASNAYDAIGHTVRLTPVVNERALAGAPDAVLDAAHELMRSGLLGQLSPLTWDPYPAPGMTGKSSAAGRPSVQNPDELAKAGYVFPRLHADC